jgi:hypothetical protein
MSARIYHRCRTRCGDDTFRTYIANSPIGTRVRAFICISLLGLAICGESLAQSTVGDPAPILGDQAQRIARNTSLNNTKSPQLSAKEKARRQAHRDAHSACRDRAMNYPAGTARRQVRDQCDASFAAQKRTWVEDYVSTDGTVKPAARNNSDSERKRINGERLACRKNALNYPTDGGVRSRVRQQCDDQYQNKLAQLGSY